MLFKKKKMREKKTTSNPAQPRREMNRNFLQGETRMAKRHMEKCSMQDITRKEGREGESGGGCGETHW